MSSPPTGAPWPAVASLVPELDTAGHGLAGDHDEEVGHLAHGEAQCQQAQRAQPGEARHHHRLTGREWNII